MRVKMLSLDLAQDFIGNGGRPSATNQRELAQMRGYLELGLRTQLTARQQECVRLYYYEGLTLEQTGERMGICESAACKHIKKARERLRTFLETAQQLGLV